MQMMYADGITHQDYIISWDENDVEAALIRELAKPGLVSGDQFVSDYKAALRRIDELKISGTYDDAVRIIRSKVEIANKAAEAKFMRINPHLKLHVDGGDLRKEYVGKIDRDLRNLFKGLKSPNPGQRSRFRAMYDQLCLAKKTYPEVAALLPVLERSKVRERRTRMPTPWTGEVKAMSIMRKMQAEHPTWKIAELARDADQKDPRPNTASRCRRLERLFNAKMGLRAN